MAESSKKIAPPWLEGDWDGDRVELREPHWPGDVAYCIAFGSEGDEESDQNRQYFDENGIPMGITEADLLQQERLGSMSDELEIAFLIEIHSYCYGYMFGARTGAWDRLRQLWEPLYAQYGAELEPETREALAEKCYQLAEWRDTYSPNDVVRAEIMLADPKRSTRTLIPPDLTEIHKIQRQTMAKRKK